jgi:cellulose biosynthesis protein BcsQ
MAFMNVPVIAFFNNKGGVDKTSLVYYLAWMYKQLDLRILAADLDPQANLTAAFLDEDRLEPIWLDEDTPNTIFKCIQSLIRGVGDIEEHPQIKPADGALGAHYKAVQNIYQYFKQLAYKIAEQIELNLGEDNY